MSRTRSGLPLCLPVITAVMTTPTVWQKGRLGESAGCQSSSVPWGTSAVRSSLEASPGSRGRPGPGAQPSTVQHSRTAQCSNSTLLDHAQRGPRNGRRERSNEIIPPDSFSKPWPVVRKRSLASSLAIACSYRDYRTIWDECRFGWVRDGCHQCTP